MRRKSATLLCTAMGLCLLSGTVISGDLTVKGSTTVLPIAQVCAEVYMEANPDITISVQGGGSGVGIASLLDGTCDIANASREIKKEEIERAREEGIDPKANVVARDAIAVVVHPTNPVEGLTLDQIKDIYTGKISNWSKVGGEDKKIVILSRDSASGTFEAFNKLVLGKERVRPDALLQASNQAIAVSVSKTPCAIGYIGLGYVSDNVKVLSVDEIEPSKETALSGEYPLSRPLFMYTNGEPTGDAKVFLDFVLSEAGQRLVEENGYVGVD
jgi:phosphate transport system substrate-binding protein